jgi:adenosine deaminase CECR1
MSRITSALPALALTVAVFSTCTPRPTPPSPARGAADAIAPVHYDTVEEYRKARARLIEQERARRLGAGLVLSVAEQKADDRMRALRRAEIDRTRDYFPPAHSYLRNRTKQAIAASPVLEVMKRMPKGGILHAHGGAMGDFRWLVSHATYRPDCYMYVGEDGAILRGTLRISAAPPGEGWRRVVDLRGAAPDRASFDEEIYRSITLGEEDLAAPNTWAEMSDAFQRTAAVVTHPAIRTDYWRNMFASLIAENVQYLESRTVGVDASLIAEARSRDPAFDVKFIPAAGRSSTREQMRQDLDEVLDRRAREPDRIKGFDLVQEEDKTNTNLFFLHELLAARREAARRGTTLPFYLHSGESTSPDNENLYDAVLLGAPRIGHGLALIRHPLLMEIIKARGIAVEVCPISNQVLGYVADLRNHPAVHFISAGLQIVLSPDDPAIMRQTFSEDFYVAFIAWGLGLKELKQLAMNSLMHSAMSDEEKQKALAAWRTRWDTFIEWVNRSPVPSSSSLPAH